MLRTSKGYFGGNVKQASGRLQLWATTTHRDAHAAQLDLLNSSMSTSPLTNRNRVGIFSQAPMLPAQRISQEVISLPGLTRASTAASRSPAASPSRSSVASLSSIARPSPVRMTKTTKTIKTTNSANSDDVGIMADMPNPPRLVFFLEDTSKSPSLMVINGTIPLPSSGTVLLNVDDAVDGRIKLNPDLCKCSGKKEKCQCRKVFLQGTKGDVRASEIAPMGEVLNLASAGRYQGCEGMNTIKGLKLVPIEFVSSEGE